jgi:anti-anti-sigma regulatory factor
MTLKIEKDREGNKRVMRLSGRLRSEYLNELKTQIEGDATRVVLDLDGVTLVDIEVVRFLNACEAGGVEILNGSPYIREWMHREQNSKE